MGEGEQMTHEESVVDLIKRQLYFSTEIAELVSSGFSFADLKKVQELSENHPKELDEKMITNNPKLARLVLLMKHYVETAHCPICTTVCLVGAFLGSRVEEVKNQQLH